MTAIYGPPAGRTRSFANCLASVAADCVMDPMLRGLERDLADMRDADAAEARVRAMIQSFRAKAPLTCGRIEG